MVGALIRRINDEVVKKGIGVQEIVDNIFDLPDVGGDWDSSYFNTYADNLRGSKSAAAVFDRVRQHWNTCSPLTVKHAYYKVCLHTAHKMKLHSKTSLASWLTPTCKHLFTLVSLAEGSSCEYNVNTAFLVVETLKWN